MPFHYPLPASNSQNHLLKLHFHTRLDPVISLLLQYKLIYSFYLAALDLMKLLGVASGLNTSHSQRLNSEKPLGTGRCGWWCPIDPCPNELLPLLVSRTLILLVVLFPSEVQVKLELLLLRPNRIRR